MKDVRLADELSDDVHHLRLEGEGSEQGALVVEGDELEICLVLRDRGAIPEGSNVAHESFRLKAGDLSLERGGFASVEQTFDNGKADLSKALDLPVSSPAICFPTTRVSRS